MFQKPYEQHRLCGSSSAALKRVNILKINVNCSAFKVSVIQACVNFLINCTNSKYTFANLVKIEMREGKVREGKLNDGRVREGRVREGRVRKRG